MLPDPPDPGRSVLDDLPVGVLVQGPLAEIRYANRAALRLLGVTMDQLLGRTSYDPDWDVVRLDGTSLAGSEHPVPQAIRTRSPVEDVVMGVSRPGPADRVWLKVSAVPRLLPDGQVADVLCTFSDITREHASLADTRAARERAEEQLRDQIELQISAYRAMSEGVVLHASDGAIQTANDSAARLLGLTLAQLMGRSPMDPRWGLVNEDGRAARPEEIPSEITRLTGRPVRNRVLGVNRPDGSRTWLSISTSPVGDEVAPFRTVATLTDVTDIRRARFELERSEAQLQRVTAAVPGVIFEAMLLGGDQWRTTFLSGQVEQVLGLPLARLLADPLALVEEVLYDEDLPGLLAVFGREDTSAAEHICRVVRHGEARWVRVWARRMVLAQGTRWTGFVVDVDAEQRLQERVQQSQRLEAMSSLAAGVAHNFNNMLGAILPNLDLVLERAPADLQRPLEDARKAASSAAELVRQLLRAARGEADVHATAVDVRDELRQVAEICRGTFRGVELHVDLGYRPIPVWATGALIQQVALNLMINARDAVERAVLPSIALAASRIDRPEASYARIQVTDNGEGMSDETLARLGEPFFTTKPPGKGTGLGIASLYGIVADLGGSVTVSSRLGQGTRFTVELPLTHRTAQEEAPTASPRGRVAGRRVLLIDDEALVRGAVRRVLEARGLSVLEAASGPEGLGRIEEGDVDAVLLDLSMPRVSGADTLVAIKERKPDLPVAILTGHAELLPSLELADGVLRKPIGAAGLMAWLQRVLPVE